MIHVCETCGGEGAVIEFRRFAGEYMAGEPVEVLCPDCDGEGEFDDEPPARKPFVPDPQYIAWLAEIDAKRAELMALRDADGSLGDPFEKRDRKAA